jgi:hypothetical protein
MAFYEHKQHAALAGKMDEWVRIMEDEIIPFQLSKGMVICGSFKGETDESLYMASPKSGRAACLAGAQVSPLTTYVSTPKYRRRRCV